MDTATHKTLLQNEFLEQFALEEVAGRHAYKSLMDHFSSLANLTAQQVTKTSVDEAVDSQFMALTFIARQLDHVESIVRLGVSYDLALIVRSMVEGMVNALWVQKDLDNLSRQWRAFSLVHDLRLAQAKGEDAPAMRAIRERLTNEGYHGLFLSDKARSLLRKGKPAPSDPYVDNWRCKSLRATFLELDYLAEKSSKLPSDAAARLYEIVYRMLSEWHHWDVAGLGRALSRTPWGLAYMPATGRSSASSIVVAYQCLHATAAFANLVLNWQIDSELEALAQSFVQDARLPERA